MISTTCFLIDVSLSVSFFVIQHRVGSRCILDGLQEFVTVISTETQRVGLSEIICL